MLDNTDRPGEALHRTAYLIADAELGALETPGVKFDRQHDTRKRLLQALVCDPRDDEMAVLFRALLNGMDIAEKAVGIAEGDDDEMHEAAEDLEAATTGLVEMWRDRASYLEATLSGAVA